MKFLFTFWKENKTDNEYQLTAEELVDKFKAWLLRKDQEWLEYYNIVMIVRCFITANDGLKSTFKESEMPSILSHLERIYLLYTYPEQME